MTRHAGLCALLFGFVCPLAAQVGTVSVGSYAGFTPTAPVAPGSLASAYGSFGNVPLTTWNGTGTMPKQLANVAIRVNNVDCPLYFVSGGQINFNVPGTTPSGKQPVDVVVSGNVVAQGSVNVYDFFPALAASNTLATRPGIILNQDSTVNSATAPATRGSVIQLFATGCGATSPVSLDGIPQGAAAPAVAKVVAYVAVDEAVVSYAGAQPQYPGICQVNIQIPDKSYITGDVPLYITANGVASNPVSVRVQ